jgi:hypothetical protein
VHIVSTADTLHRRVAERFPNSGLSQVASELEEISREAATLATWMARPNWYVRAALLVAIVGLIMLPVSFVFAVKLEMQSANWSDFVQGIEALVNEVVFIGIAIFFLLGVEVRMKRRRALGALHVLRSLAHIVDMHQLTKHPESGVFAGPHTESSPKRRLSPFELTRYLDYSSEMLAIISKIAALYVQESRDPATVDAASAVEDLAVGLSRAIWQKITILDHIADNESRHEA